MGHSGSSGGDSFTALLVELALGKVPKAGLGCLPEFEMVSVRPLSQLSLGMEYHVRRTNVLFSKLRGGAGGCRASSGTPTTGSDVTLWQNTQPIWLIASWKKQEVTRYEWYL